MDRVLIIEFLLVFKDSVEATVENLGHRPTSVYVTAISPESVLLVREPLVALDLHLLAKGKGIDEDKCDFNKF